MTHMLLFLAVAGALRTSLDVTPVEKVVTLLEDLQSQTQEEGRNEAGTYDKFACFCKSKTDGKVESIQKGEMTVSELTASLVQLEATKEELAADISKLTTDIAQLEADLKLATEIREKEHAIYEVAFADAEAAVNALQSAIASIEGSKQSLAQVKAAVQKSLALADAMNIKPKDPQAIAAFLQQPFEAPAEGEPDYKFHSGGIIATLEDLLEKFSTQKDTIQAEEEKAAAAFDAAAKGKREEIESSKATLETKEGELSETETRIAEDTESLTEAKALLADDKTYLKDLTGQCEVKAREWDQRASLRNQELAAIAKALEIITGTVAEKAEITGAGGRSDAKPVVEEAPADGALMQHKSRKSKRAKAGLVQEQEDADVEDYTDVVFVQTAAVRKTGDAQALALRNKVIALLKSQGATLKSTDIALLTMKLAADPFAKVKTLIQQLIERLLREAANEATHKGWCDTEIGKAEKDREFRHQDLLSLNADITDLEARKAALELDISNLTEELQKLNEDLAEATKLRLEEKADNKETLENASEGLVALKQALEVLKDFYKQAGKGKVALVQASPVGEDLAAEGAGAGFSGAYKGNQAQGQGIIGMLETIASDFERTQKDTEAAEFKAHRAFVDYERETKASIATKETGLSQATKDLSQTNGDLVAALNDLQSNQKLLDASLETLEKLRPACVDTGMSYEERVERREAEIAALKNAVCVLDEEDSAISNCAGGKWTGGFLQK